MSLVHKGSSRIIEFKMKPNVHEVCSWNGERRVELSSLLVSRVVVDECLLDWADRVSWVIREQTLGSDNWATHWNMLETRLLDIQLKSNWRIGIKANQGVVERVQVSHRHWWKRELLLIIARVNRLLRRENIKERHRVVVVAWARLSSGGLASTVRIRARACHLDRVRQWVVDCSARLSSMRLAWRVPWEKWVSKI